MEAIQTRALPNFSRREMDIFPLVARSYTRHQISEMLGISYKTVDFHMHSIFIKTRLHSQMKLASYAIEHNLGRQEVTL